MRTGNRKSAPEVSGGKVKKKNNWEISPNYYDTPQALPVIDRKRPGKGYRHLLKKKDIYDFIAILPDWPELSRGLNAIVLAPGGERWEASYDSCGVIRIGAWKEELWITTGRRFYEEHQELYQRLDVLCVEASDGTLLCQWDESTAKAFQLLHLLLHELGHHHDRMTTETQRRGGRGEPYAEAYALAYEAKIWDDYQRRFGLG